MTRIPSCVVHTISVFLESTDAGWAVNGPKFDGIVPGGGEERIATSGIVISRVNLASMLVEGTDGISVRWKSGVVDFDGAVSGSGD